MQDEVQISKLITATTVTGTASNLTLQNQDGSVIGASGTTIDIQESGVKVAVGSYGYGLSSDATGLSLTYGLTKLALEPNQTTTLAGDNSSPGASEFHGQLTGAGNLAIEATNTIHISNSSNDYTGTTTINGGIASLGTDNALGNTSALTILTGAGLNLNGHSQTVGQLSVDGMLDLASGTLNVSNGGTTAAGTLRGAGSFNLTGGTLTLMGANPDLAATTQIAVGAVMVLKDTSGLGSGDVIANGTLNLDAFSGTFMNQVSGIGSIDIKDNSTVTLANTQNYSGGTKVSPGATITLMADTALGQATGPLELDNSTLTLGANIDLAATRPLTFNNDVTFDTNGFTTTVSQAVNGSGILRKQGAGTLQLTGDSPYTGTMTVNQGHLKVNATIANADIVVNPGAQLSGNSTVSSISNNGTVTPGNSIGTINVGNYDNTGGIYECEVNDAGQSDLINVTGSTILNGILSIIPQPGNYQSGQIYEYTVLRSATPINTTFTTVSGTSSLFSYTPVYYPDSVVIQMMMKISELGTLVPHGNAGVVARNLDKLGQSSGSLSNAIAALNTLSNDLGQMTEALNQLDTAQNAAIQQQLAVNFFDLSETLSDSLHNPLERSAISQSPLAAHVVTNISSLKSTFVSLSTPVASKALTGKSFGVLPSKAQLPKALRAKMGQASIWINTGAKDTQQKDQRSLGTIIPELKATVVSTKGGIDYQFTSQFLGGITVGYAHTAYHLSNNRGSGQVDSCQLGLYGSLFLTPEWYVDGLVSYATNRIKGKRKIAFANFATTARQSHHAGQIGGHLETGYDVELTGKTTLTPMASAALVHLEDSAYTETNADTTSLRVKAHRPRHIQTKTGAQLGHHWSKDDTQFYGFVKVAYMYRKRLGNGNITSGFINQPDFTVFTNSKPNNMASTGAGFSALFNNNTYITLGYNGDFGKKQRSHEAFLKIGKRF